ncbi:MAG TPA: YitT family protein [Candidatus Nosocomiicoccus stercorigallinarum]|nr:YitT family protein [Candidatus Nosocomiicoccus stercorigallinarum]
MEANKKEKIESFNKRKLSFNKNLTVQTLINAVVITIGSFIFAVGVNTFMIGGNLAEGGVIGISIILFYAFGWSTALTNLIINSIILAIGFKFLSRRAMYYTIFSIPMTSLMLWFTESWQMQFENVIVNMIFGGMLIGIGIGLIFRVGATTAGTTILARIANKYLDVNVSYALLFFDLLVVLSGLTVIPLERVLLTIIALYVATKVMDFIIEGMNPKKAVTIISNKSELLAEHVTKDIKRGVTIMHGRGYYTQENKDVLYIVINKNQLGRLKRVIKKNDESAFVVVHDVNDVLGNFII